MEAKHTPGPWLAFNMIHAERGDRMTPDELGEYVANNVRKTLGDGGSTDFLFISTQTDDAPDICHIGNGPAGPANARLISAAPDLLVAVEGMVAVYAMNNAEPAELVAAMRHQIAGARAAIAKAGAAR